MGLLVGSHTGSVGGPQAGLLVATGTSSRWPVSRVSQLGFLVGIAGGQQHGGGDAGGGGQVVVALEQEGGLVGCGLGGVVVEEEVDLAVGVLPADIGVGGDQPTPLGLAATGGPPAHQPGAGAVAGGVGELGEHGVDGQQVGQAPVGVRHPSQLRPIPARPVGGGASVGGQDRGAGLAEQVVVGGAAGPHGLVGAEPVDHLEGGEGGEALLQGPRRRAQQQGEQAGGEDLVVAQQPAHLPVASGEPAGQGGQLLGRRRARRGGCGGRSRPPSLLGWWEGDGAGQPRILPAGVLAPQRLGAALLAGAAVPGPGGRAGLVGPAGDGG